MKESTRIIFTQGGKGGVGKTEVALGLVDWYRQRGLSPSLIDFDIENSTKSGFQNFYPEALKLDVHEEGALDEFFDVCENSEGLVVADLGAGAGESTFAWFDEAFEDAKGYGIVFTSVAVSTNDAGAVQSVLKWGAKLQDRVDYLVVLNEGAERNSKFEYWKAEPKVKEFIEVFEPKVIAMRSRIQEFQAELRNHSATLRDVLDETLDVDFFRLLKNRMRARRYHKGLTEGFEHAKEILLP